MDTNKVFSILRLVDHHPDPSERLFPNYASMRGVWFQLLARFAFFAFVVSVKQNGGSNIIKVLFQNENALKYKAIQGQKM